MKTTITRFAIMSVLLLAALAVRAQVRPPLFEEDFESVSEGSLPVGWNNDSVSGDVQTWSAVRGGGREGSVCLSYKDNDYKNEGYNLLTSPEISVVDDGLALSFDYKLLQHYSNEKAELLLFISYDGGRVFDDEPYMSFQYEDNEWHDVLIPLPVSVVGKITLGFLVEKDGQSYLECYIDNVKIDYEPRCARPFGLKVFDIHTDKVSLSWTFDVMGAVSDVVEYVLRSGDGQIIRDEIVSTDKIGEMTVSGLESNTSYSVQLRSNCENAYLGQSLWSEELTFKTSCGAASFPVTYSFDDWYQIDECWKIHGEGDYNAQVCLSSEYSWGVGQSIKIPSGEQDIYVFTPPVEHPADDIEISLYVYNDSWNESSLEIGIQTDIELASTYLKLGEYTLKPDDWTHIVVNSAGIVPEGISGASVVFWTKGLDLWPIYIDNVCIDKMPDCPRPENVTVSSYDNRSAVFEWNYAKGTSIDVYNISLGDTAFIGTVSKDKNELSGLSPDTEYNFIFRTKCSDGNSNWGTDIIDIVTSCDPCAGFEIESFEHDGHMPACWKITDKGDEWEISEMRSRTGKYSLRMEDSYSPYSSDLVLPYLDLAEGTAYQLSFYLYKDSEDNTKEDKINVYVNQVRDDTSGAELLGTVYRSTLMTPHVPSAGWYECTFDIPMNGTCYVILEAITDNGTPIYIDDIKVATKPSCAKPENVRIEDITSSSLRLSWIGQTDQHDWEITYGYDNDMYVDTVLGNNEFEINGLAENTEYHIGLQIVSLCGDDRSEPFETELDFKTFCEPKDITNGSYVEDFSDNDDWGCWTVLESYEEWSTVYPYPSSGKLYLRGGKNTFIMPDFNWTDIAEYRVTFEFLSEDNHLLEVGIMSNPADISTFVSLDSIIGTDILTEYKVSFGGYDGIGKYVAFRYTGDNTGWDAASELHNIIIDAIPLCPDIISINVDSIYDVKTEFTVQAAQEVGSYEIQYGYSGFHLGEGLAVDTVFSNKFTLNGIEGDVDYDLYVRTLCGSDAGDWYGPVSWTTYCERFVVTKQDPFDDGFENYSYADMGCWFSYPIAGDEIWTVTSSSYDSYEGLRCMSLGTWRAQGYQADLYYPVSLGAGMQYLFSCFANVSDKVSGGRIEIAFCETSDPDELGDYMSINITETSYSEIKFFFVPDKNVNFLRIRGVVPEGVESLMLDNISIRQVLCKYPETVIVSGVTDRSATVAWEAGADAWNVKVSTEAIDPITESGNIVNDTDWKNSTMQLSNLQPQQEYFVYVQAICGSDVSDWTSAVEFKTLCLAESLPMYESFDDEASFDCWLLIGEGQMESSDNISYDGSQCCRITTESSAVLVTPLLDAGDGLWPYMMTADIYAVESGSISIGVMNDPSDIGSLYPLTTISVPAGEWVEAVSYFSVLEQPEFEAFADAAHIVVITNGDIYVDNLSVSEVPECPKPSAVTIAELSDEYVKIGWSLYEPGECLIVVSDDDGYKKEFRTEELSVEIHGLSANHRYNVDVVLLCDGQESEHVTQSFMTLCGKYPIPFTEKFDTVHDVLPECWSDDIRNNQSEYNHWLPYTDADGIKCVRFDSYNNPRGAMAMLSTPVVDLTGNSEAVLSFRTKSPQNSRLDVLISTDGGYTFNDTLSGNVIYTDWTDVEYDISEYCGLSVVIGFAGYSNWGSGDAYIYLDNVSVSLPPACPKPGKLTVTSVDSRSVNMVIDDDNAVRWEVALGLAGFDPDTAAVTYVFDEKNIEIADIQPSTSYHVYIRAICDDVNDKSAWLGPVSFVTDCVKEDLPYSLDFENYSDVSEMQCYDFLVPGYGSPKIEIVDDEVISGSRSLQIDGYLYTYDTYFVLPEMNADINDIMIDFKYRVVSDDLKNCYMGVIHKDSIDVIKDKFVPLMYIQPGNTAGEYLFESVCGYDYRIAFKVAYNLYNTVILDDIRVYEKPSFYPPRDLVISDITESSAVLTWTKSPDATASEIVVSGVEDTITDASGRYEVNGLNANTEYSVRIRDIRLSVDGSKDTTEWRIPQLFHTTQVPVDLPLFEDFESDGTSDLWSLVNGESMVRWVISGDDPTAVYEGNKALYIQGENNDNSYTAENASIVYAYRTLDLAVENYAISFVYHSNGRQSLYMDDYLNVYLVPANCPLVAGQINVQASWIDITGNLTSTQQWRQFRSQVKIDSAGYYNLVFLWQNDDDVWPDEYLPAAVDSLVFAEIECMPVIMAAVDSVTSTSAVVSWTSDNVKDASYEYVLLSGDMSFDEENADKRTAMNDSVRLEQLLPSTDYSVYVRALCGEYYTDWYGPLQFSTYCAPDTVRSEQPYVDDFEEVMSGCWIVFPVDVWSDDTMFNRPLSGEGNLLLGAGEGSLFRNLYLYAGIDYQVSFYVAGNADVYTGGYIAMCLNDGFDYGVSDVIYRQPVFSDNYIRHTVHFSVPEDGDYTLGLYGVCGNDTECLFLDSFAITAVVCGQPSLFELINVTANTADISWRGNADAYNVILEGVATAEEYVVNGNAVSLRGLSPSTTYTLRVRSQCSESEVSDAAVYVFTTECTGEVVAPYYEDFDAYVTIPPCWNTVGKSASISWMYYAEQTGNGVAYFNSRENDKGVQDTLVAPEVRIPEEGYYMSVDYINPSGGPLSIYISADGGLTYQETLLDSVTGAAAWNTVSWPLDAYVGESVTMVVIATSSYSLMNDAYTCIDNFRISKVAETKRFMDTVCYAEAYVEHGFDIPSIGLTYGENVVRRVAYGSVNVPDTLYEVSLYVPQTDYYVQDVMRPGTVYTGYGFDNGITEPGRDYTRTLVSSIGCDSIVHLQLTPVDLDVTIDTVICEGDSYLFCGEEKAESGEWTCSVEIAPGVDSVTTLHLTVLPSLVERFDTICQGDFIEFDGRRIMTTDTYEADSIYPGGCTYTSRLHLTVLDSIVEKDTVICAGRYVEIGGERYTEIGTYRITMYGTGGCRTTMVLDLRVLPADTVTYNTVACEGQPIYYPGFAGTEVSGATILYRSDKTVGGCDSVTCLIVDYHHTVEVYDTVSTGNAIYEYDGRTLTTGGDYISTGRTADGCDSIHHLHLTFTTGLGMTEIHNLVIAPNPTQIGVTAYADGSWTDADIAEGMTVEILDATGRRIYIGEVAKRPIPVEGLNVSGVYIIRITSADGVVYTGRLMVR